MLTFLELYQTLLGFVFFRLYSDINLVYPPKLDTKSDDEAAGIGALLLEETSRTLTIEGKKVTENALGNERRVTAKDVKKQIRNLAQQDLPAEDQSADNDISVDAAASAAVLGEATDFSKPTDGTNDASIQFEQDTTNLYENYYFYLSREVTRPTLEFIIRSFGGQVGWDAILGAGSPFTVKDPRITHHVIDRPVPASTISTDGVVTSSSALTLSDLPGKRALIQPQWVVDCINLRKLLPTDPYAPGKVLPPHLSPFVNDRNVKEKGGYAPRETESAPTVEGELIDEEDEEDEEDESDVENEMIDSERAQNGVDDMAAQEDHVAAGPALMEAATNLENASLMHAAELEAEAGGIPYSKFQTTLATLAKQASKTAKKASNQSKQVPTIQEQNPASILLSNKQRKLFNKMKFGENKRREEADKLSEKRKVIRKADKQLSRV